MEGLSLNEAYEALKEGKKLNHWMLDSYIYLSESGEIVNDRNIPIDEDQFFGNENFNEGWKVYYELKSRTEILQEIEESKRMSEKDYIGCNFWYNPGYAIQQTFSKDEIDMMSEDELNHLWKLAENLSESLV